MEDSSVRGRGDKQFQVIINIILIFCLLCAVLPFVMLVASSFTAEEALMREGYNFWPKQFSAYAYQYLFSTNGVKVFQSYKITFIITIIGTCLSLLIGPMLAWPLSRKDYKRSKIFTFLVFFTMLFNGFYIILYKNNFSSNIHPALVEAAKIDGAGEFYIYFKIVLPLSLPIMALYPFFQKAFIAGISLGGVKE